MKTRTIEEIDWLLIGAEDGQRVKKQIERMKRTLKKRGAIEIDTTSATCFNYSENQKPNEKGEHDKMGHSSEDVNVTLDNEWWNITKKDEFFLLKIPSFIVGVYEFFSCKYLYKDLIAVRSKTELSSWYQNVKRLFRIWVLSENPFRTQTQHWIFVADSMQDSLASAAYEMAEDIIAKKRGYKNSDSLFKARREFANKDEAEAISDRLLKEDKEAVIRYIEEKQGMRKWNEFLWVSTSDPTCFILDETNGPVKFGMRDGWTREEIAQVIKYYLDTLFPVEAGWVVRVTKQEPEEE